MKKQITLIIFCAMTLITYAQNATSTSNAIFSQWGASLNLTTNGIGVEASTNISKDSKFIARFGGNYLSYKLVDYQTNFSDRAILANGKVEFGAIGAYVDWYPFNNPFKVTGGLSYMITNANIVVLLKDSAQQGKINISPEEVGQINIDIKTLPITPYLGIGYGYSIPNNKRVGVSFEIGAYYIGAPKVGFVATKMLEPSTSQGKTISDNLNEYRWLPKVSFSINFKINK